MAQKSNLYSMDAKSLLDNSVAWWTRKYKTVFFAMFLAICSWGGFLWYYSLYYFQWTPEQKQAYIDSQSRRTVFNQSEFEKALRVLDDREGVYRSDSLSIKNIFATEKKSN